MGLHEVRRHGRRTRRLGSVPVLMARVAALAVCLLWPAGCGLKAGLAESLWGKGGPPQAPQPQTQESETVKGTAKTTPPGGARRTDTQETRDPEKSEQAEAAKSIPDSIDPFPKMDHRKHNEIIRHKAIDILNQAGRCDTAILCEDAVTEGWTLTLYTKSEKSFSMTVYTWNPIDSKWTKIFTSKAHALKGWENHLRTGSAGKQCRVLKGNAP